MERIEVKMTVLMGAEATMVVRIHKKPGDPVTMGEALFECEGNKGNTTVYAEAAGRVESISVQLGDMVKTGDLLATLLGEGQEESEGGSPQTDRGDSMMTGAFNYFGTLLTPQKRELQSKITIVGGGPGGYVAAIYAAQLGASVVLVEKDALGGTCLNRGCIPTKAMIRSAEVFQLLSHAQEFGLSAEHIGVNIKAMVQRKNKIVDQLVQGIDYLLRKNGVIVVAGEGELIDEHTIQVTSQSEETTIHAQHVIIATGSATSRPPIPGIENRDVLTSDEILNLQELPQRLAIIGGGVIGLEFAFLFANLGVEVSVIEYLDHCLGNFDPDICTEMARSAAKKGIRIYNGAKVDEILTDEDQRPLVAFVQDERKKFVAADKVLLSVGRKPYLEGLGIDKLDLLMNPAGRGISVNERMQTNIPHIYAIGDVTGGIMLAHVASHQGIVAVKNIMGSDTTMQYHAIPSAVFTDPEIAMVGMGEQAAREAGLEIEVGKFPFAANGKALTLGEPIGFIKMVVGKATGKVIGSAIIGPHATDLIAELGLAVQNGLTVEQFVETIHAHPTTAEVVHEAALATCGRAIHFVDSDH